jgi:hypothetical protein
MPTLELINIGTAVNDDTGDPLRTAMAKVNAAITAFNELETVGSIDDVIAGLQAKDPGERLNLLYIDPVASTYHLSVASDHGMQVGDDISFRVKSTEPGYLVLEPVDEQFGQLLEEVGFATFVAVGDDDVQSTFKYPKDIRRLAGAWQSGDNEAIGDGSLELDANLFGPNKVVRLDDDVDLDDILHATDDGGLLTFYQGDATTAQVTFDGTVFEELTDVSMNTGAGAKTYISYAYRPAMDGGAIPAKIALVKVA